jgi:hypothetical protein
VKRIIDGVAYNTATATLIARSEAVYEADRGRSEERMEWALYQTRGGAFFLHTCVSSDRWNSRTEEKEEVERHDFEPMSREAAHEWTMKGQVELLVDSVFGDPPEASDEEEAGATIYVRMPQALKASIEAAAARDGGLSVNSWMMRAAEEKAASKLFARPIFASEQERS